MTAVAHGRGSASTSTRSRRFATRAAATSRASSTRCGVCVDAGAPGITVHPRADARHITTRRRARDRRRARAAARPRSSSTSKAIRGPICSRWSTRSSRISARSCRSRRARSPARRAGRRTRRRPRLQRDRRRVCRTTASASACSSIPSRTRCAGPRRSAPIASSSTPSRSRARSRASRESGQASFAAVCGRGRRSRTSSGSASTPATISTSTNLTLFRTLPHLDEVSIGHALISHALFVGLDRAVRDYLAALGA